MRIDQTVDEVMRRWPLSIEIFLVHKMYCAGCPVAAFHTVEEACKAHGIQQDEFLAALRTAWEPQEAG